MESIKINGWTLRSIGFYIAKRYPSCKVELKATGHRGKVITKPFETEKAARSYANEFPRDTVCSQ